MTMRLLYHVHTFSSYDSIMRIEDIISHCKKNNITHLAITDHDCIERLEEYKLLCSQQGITLVPGIEYSSKAGDIIGLFVRSKIDTKSPNRILDHIKEEEGIAILPHPYYGHELDLIDFSKIDMIETFNSRCTEEMNEKAVLLCRKHEKVPIVAADAHIKDDLSSALNIYDISLPIVHSIDEIKVVLLSEEPKFETHRIPMRNLYISQIWKGCKQRNFVLIYRNIAKYILNYPSK